MTEVNIGTEEHPVLVPEVALEDGTEASAAWWSMLATGSVTLTDEQLEALLTYLGTRDE